MGQLDAAENAAKAALRIDANSQPAGQLLDDIRQVRPPKRAQSTDVLSQTPDAKKHYERGEAFLNNKQYNEAVRYIQKVNKGRPKFCRCALRLKYRLSGNGGIR